MYHIWYIWKITVKIFFFEKSSWIPKSNLEKAQLGFFVIILRPLVIIGLTALKDVISLLKYHDCCANYINQHCFCVNLMLFLSRKIDFKYSLWRQKIQWIISSCTLVQMTGLRVNYQKNSMINNWPCNINQEQKAWF